MASTKDPIVCHVCGFKNEPNTERCVSCGARLEAVQVEYTAEEEAARANQQDGFSILWVAISFVIYLVLQGVIIGLLPLVIPTYDPQGFAGLAISVAVWFVGGVAVGLVSPGKTFLEPAVGALVATIPTIVYLKWSTPDGFEPSLIAYLVGGSMGVMISLFGAFLGEQIQRRTRGHKAK
ncbi:MAG: hypothetical protein ACK5U8_09720 [Deltaproteobacteria bacterium]|jgi:hypothetical protein